jgi:hypothetical protein
VLASTSPTSPPCERGSNRASVARFSPSRGGEWFAFPYVITHKGGYYFRLYPVAGSRPTVIYTVDGEEVSREAWMGYLTPSERAKMESGDRPDCITVKAENCEFPSCEG